MKKTIIEHWSYNDGWRYIIPALRSLYDGKDKVFDEYLVGWHCWAYATNDGVFEDWMKNNMIGGYDCAWRFNGGSPMYTVMIKTDEDATLFKLRWM